MKAKTRVVGARCSLVSQAGFPAALQIYTQRDAPLSFFLFSAAIYRGVRGDLPGKQTRPS